MVFIEREGGFIKGDVIYETTQTRVLTFVPVRIEHARLELLLSPPKHASATSESRDRGKDISGQMMRSSVRACARPEPVLLGVLYVPDNTRARCLCRSTRRVRTRGWAGRKGEMEKGVGMRVDGPDGLFFLREERVQVERVLNVFGCIRQISRGSLGGERTSQENFTNSSQFVNTIPDNPAPNSLLDEAIPLPTSLLGTLAVVLAMHRMEKDITRNSRNSRCFEFGEGRGCGKDQGERVPVALVP